MINIYLPATFENIKNSIAIEIIPFDKLNIWLKKQDHFTKQWLLENIFQIDLSICCLPDQKTGKLSKVIIVVKDMDALQDMWFLSKLIKILPLHKTYYFTNITLFKRPQLHFIAWGLACYIFSHYKKPKQQQILEILVPSSLDLDLIQNIFNATCLVRDLINFPASYLNPSVLAQRIIDETTTHNAKIQVISGESLINLYPATYIVGNASINEPLMLTIQWGEKSHPLVTLIGKGVCFDTGGLDLKTTKGMALMKKDMAGAAHVLALAKMIMQENLHIRLKVFIPIVENSIGANAYRPSDIITMNNHTNVEISNTDAEGRLILADAIIQAVKDKPN